MPISGRSRNGLLAFMSAGGTLISQVALIAGGIFAAFQYIDARRDAQVEHTMEYIVRYEDGRVGESRRAIETALRPYLPNFAEIQNQGVRSQDRIDVISTLMTVAGEGSLPGHVDTVVDFYEGLWTCVREDVCSKEVALGYFGGADAADFRANFQPYIDQRRENNPTYARGLDRFANPPVSPT
jgi:hypothetical protein